MSTTNSYQSLKSIIDITVVPEYSIKLKDSFWVMLKSDNGVVEGKLYLSPNKLSKLVIFEPGFPGGGSTQFEQLWLDKLLQNDFSVFLARHSGTTINGKYSQGYLNCTERQELSKTTGLKVLGNKDVNTIADWLNEPLVALDVLTPHFSEAILCGHSFGPLALIHSLITFSENEPALTKKVVRLISLSGSIGRIRSDNEPILKIWFDHLNTDWAKERVQVGDARENTNIFRDAHVKINNEASKIPQHIGFIALSPVGDTEKSFDEIVNPLESIDFINSLGRGYFIADKIEYGNKETGRMAHDMEALPADFLLNLMSNNWRPSSQISILT